MAFFDLVFASPMFVLATLRLRRAVMEDIDPPNASVRLGRLSWGCSPWLQSMRPCSPQQSSPFGTISGLWCLSAVVCLHYPGERLVFCRQFEQRHTNLFIGDPGGDAPINDRHG